LLKPEFYANFGPVLCARQKKSLPWALVGRSQGGLTERCGLVLKCSRACKIIVSILI